jgi:hypothetical protein
MTAELLRDSELVVVPRGLLLDHASHYSDFALCVLHLPGDEVQAARRVQVAVAG